MQQVLQIKKSNMFFIVFYLQTFDRHIEAFSYLTTQTSFVCNLQKNID